MESTISLIGCIFWGYLQFGILLGIYKYFLFILACYSLVENAHMNAFRSDFSFSGKKSCERYFAARYPAFGKVFMGHPASDIRGRSLGLAS